MAAPRPKKTTVVKKKPLVVKKKPPVVKKKTDVKSPAETRKSLSRKQVGTNRLQNIINEGAEGRRLPVQEASPKRLTVSQPEKVRINIMDKLLKQDRKGTPNRAVTPRVINQGYTPGSASRAVVPSTATSASAKIGSSAGSKTLTLLRGFGILGAIVDPIASAVPAGTGSTVPGQAQKAVEKKMKREIRQGPELAVAGVKEGVIGKTRSLRNKTGQNRPEYPTWKNKPKASKKPLENRLMKPAPGANYSGQGTASSSATYSGYGDDFKMPKTSSNKSSAIMPKASMSGGSVNNPSGKSSGDALRRRGAGTFTAPYDVKSQKSGPSNTAATAAAASSSGTSQATKKKSRSPTRYQRNELAMEQRKSPSGKPKKSIFTSGKPKKSILSLFRKG